MLDFLYLIFEHIIAFIAAVMGGLFITFVVFGFLEEVLPEKYSGSKAMIVIYFASLIILTGCIFMTMHGHIMRNPTGSSTHYEFTEEELREERYNNGRAKSGADYGF